jgi:uncharacterized protein YkwD
MLRSTMAFAATSVSLLALSAAAQDGQASSSSFRRCSGAHKSSYKSSHCGKQKGGKRHSHSHALFFTAVNGHCRDANMSPSAANVAQVRAATLCLVNRERARHGERALYWNNKLIRAAQAHTESMAFGGYFAHVGSNGSTPLARMRRFGYAANAHTSFEVGENIGFGSLWLGTPRAVVAAWMASPGHRANILDRRYRETGIGVSSHLGRLAHGQPGGMYTQDFGVIG